MSFKIELDPDLVELILDIEDAANETPKLQKTIVEEWVNNKLEEILEDEIS